MNKVSKKFIPVLRLSDVVVYPSMIAPIFITKSDATIAVENSLLTEDHKILLVLEKPSKKAKEPQEVIESVEFTELTEFIEKSEEDLTHSLEEDEERTTENLYDIGIEGKIIQVLKFPDGSVKALVEALHRVKLHDIQYNDNLLQAKYEELQEVSIEEDEKIKALVKYTLERFNEYIKRTTKINMDSFMSITEIQSAGKLADILATYLNIDVDEKQKVLELLNAHERLEYVTTVLSREIELLGIEEAIQEKVKYKLGKSQKEYLLREKLRAIKEELGSEDGIDELDEYKQKIEEAKVPQKVKEQLDKELSRLEKMPAYTAETAVIRTYIETVLELPWDKKTEDIIDLERAKKILDEDHHGLKDVKERILEFLAVKKLSEKPQPTIICFVGPPGVGKTSLARSIARSLNKNFAQVSLGGINDESEIRGHRRTYIGSMPGRIIRAIQDAGSKNPVILIDEIEKMIKSHMGDPTAAMLEVLDPSQNSNYTDHYIDLPFDLSEVFFIATANSLEPLYKPLRDRLETILLSGYTEEEKIHIAQDFLIPRQFDTNGIQEDKLIIEESAIREIISKYTREAGVRELERSFAKICRKFAIELVENPETQVKVNAKNLFKYLGIPKFTREEAEKKPQIGLVHGLAWTEFGGEILEIETSIMPGKGKLNLTGRLGEIMQESAKTALSYARSNYKKLNIPPDIQEKYDIHIHAADGATPKDGPSAGIALTLAIISAITHRPIRSDVAMTGEITLRGRVLPIGGLREKCIAALRSEIYNVIIPKANKKDLQDLPDYIKEKLNFKIVSSMEEVIDFALLEK